MDPEKELLLVVGRDFTTQTYSPTGSYDTFKNLGQRISESKAKAAALLKASSTSGAILYELESWKINSNLKAQ